MLRNRKAGLVSLVVLAVVALVAVSVGIWYFIVRDDGVFSYVIRNEAPPPVSLAAALDVLTPTGSSSSEGELAGTWVLASGQSFAGYRVVETLASFGTNTAVGRTSDIEGSLEYDGQSITAVDVTAGLTTLSSDQAARDEQLAVQAIETATYPAATFILSSPIAVETVPSEGESISETVTGELTLHGVTREVDVEVEAALHGGLLVVVGSTEIVFADYDIEEPISFSVLSIEEHGVMEFQLVFRKP